MKKNRMMRAASALLVAVLLTTCTISGTFAKYVTSASATDSARVAKWGVTVTTAGDLFSDAYAGVDGGNTKATWTNNENGVGITVQADTKGTDVVAPGTKNDTGITFSITGKPEVDTKVIVKVTGASNGTARADEATDIYLPAGTYKNPTVSGTDAKGQAITVDDVTLDAPYHPVKFTLTQKTEGSDAATTLVTDGTLTQVEEALEKLTTKDPIDANTDLGKKYGTYTLTWKWEYGTASESVDSSIAINDVYDTILGNAAVTPVDGISTDIDFQLQILVEQVD